jgi:hypothetical protein
MRYAGLILWAACLVGLVAACGPVQKPVPADAQQVHVIADRSTVRLIPTQVRAGEMYVILDEPTTSVAFVQGKHSADATPGPLTADDLARLARGDTQGTSIGGFDVVGCDATQRAAARNQTKVPGGCGNAFLMTLTPGSYAFMTGDPTALTAPAKVQIAILDVLP